MPLDVARRGTLDVRDPPLKAIVAANDNYEAGYHKGNVGGLDAIDTDLATANIKSGITIFGKVGSADVHDISNATAIEAEVIAGETFYAVGGGIRTGTMPTVALAAGANAYPAGYHAGAASLTAVDADLATGNIKSGVTIFGVAGAATVQDISDADAAVADVKSPKTFYSVTGARKTGTMPTVALAPGSSAYPAGYHAGDGGGLPAIDADLATGNIKSGITIFNVAGHNDVRDISDADLVEAEAPTGKTFYAVSGGRRTGTGTKTLNAANETVNAGYYAATTLSAVDVHLAAGNIKDGVNIFGFVGTYTGPALADDVEVIETDQIAESGAAASATQVYKNIAAATTLDLSSTINALTAGSRQMFFGVLYYWVEGGHSNRGKFQLIVDGVKEAESGWMNATNNDSEILLLSQSKALSGNKTALIRIENYDGVNVLTVWNGNRVNFCLGAHCVVCASIKAV